MVLSPPFILHLIFFLSFHLSTTLPLLSPSNVGFTVQLIQSGPIPSGLQYLMRLSIGTPPVEILAIADTSTDLIWTQCMPSSNQTDPLFHPNNSSTYRKISCNSNLCQFLPLKSCGANKECNYHYSSSNQSYSDGVLASDTFTFNSLDKGRVVSIPKLAFGCIHQGHGVGLVGLGASPLSLVSQLGSSIDGKFSYCLVPFKEDKFMSVLRFGEQALATGEKVSSTPLILRASKTFYYLTIESISIGNNEFVGGIGMSSAWPGKKEGNILIDMDTPFTYIPGDFLAPFKESLADLIYNTPAEDPSGVLDMCYISNEDEGFVDVKIVFRFSGANVTLGGTQMFVKVTEDVACLAMLPSKDPEMGIFGSLAQQNFHIEYDLMEKKLSLVPTDCAKL